MNFKFGCSLTAALSLLIGGAMLYEKPSAYANVAPVNSKFGFNLFKEIIKSEPSGTNVLISPNSAYYALCMVANGAKGETLTQMLSTLDVEGTVSAMNEHNRSALSAANATKKAITLETANAVFIDKSVSIMPSFTSDLRKFYNAEARTADFDSESTVGEINRWCAGHTNGKITSIISNLAPTDFMVLLNALYFKGKWDSPFQTRMSHQTAFAVGGGDKKNVTMMRKTTKCKYIKNADFESIELPYAGNAASMFILLPNNGTSIAQFLTKLNESSWKTWKNGYTTEDVALELPKFKISYRKVLNQDLQKLGMSVAFQRGKSDFSNMVKPPQHANIGMVIQKTFMDVNEEGTEAAAVTAVVMEGRAYHVRQEPKSFIVDRPFVIVLVNNASGETLFLGAINDPTAN